jgi:hypothetical protein
MLTLKSPYKEFADILIKNNACSDAVPWLEKLSKEYGELSYEEARIQMADKFGEGKEGEAWALWALITCGKEFDVDLRKVVITRIVTPTNALRLLIECDFLTEEEHIILKEKYAGKLPTAEKEILTGVVSLKTAITAGVKP